MSAVTGIRKCTKMADKKISISRSFERLSSESADDNMITDSVFCPEVNSFRSRSYHSLPLTKKPSLITKVSLRPAVRAPRTFDSLNKSPKKQSCCCGWFVTRWRRLFRRAKVAPATFNRNGIHRGSELSSTFRLRKKKLEDSPASCSHVLPPFGQVLFLVLVQFIVEYESSNY